MRKLLTGTLLAILVTAATTGAAGIGVGAFGGLNMPIAQEDNASGNIFGAKLRFKALSAITLEPNIGFTKFGDAEPEDVPGFGIEGSKITNYGIDATLGAPVGGPGIKPYFVGGVGFYNIKQGEPLASVVEDDTRFGWNAGFGFEVGFSRQIGLDLRGKLNVVPLQDGGSDKSVAATAGINFYLGL